LNSVSGTGSSKGHLVSFHVPTPVASLQSANGLSSILVENRNTRSDARLRKFTAACCGVQTDLTVATTCFT